MMKLTDDEKKIIEAFREGARVELSLFNYEGVNEAIDDVKKFGKITDIFDQKYHVVFVSEPQVRNLDVRAYVKK